MTNSHYPGGCADGSQARGFASPDASDPDYAWIVSFSYGVALLYHRDGHAFVRAVRSVPASAPGQ